MGDKPEPGKCMQCGHGIDDEMLHLRLYGHLPVMPVDEEAEETYQKERDSFNDIIRRNQGPDQK